MTLVSKRWLIPFNEVTQETTVALSSWKDNSGVRVPGLCFPVSAAATDGDKDRCTTSLKLLYFPHPMTVQRPEP